MKQLMRISCVLAVLAAGSCTAPDSPGYRSPDGAANHPISVEPDYQSLSLYYAPADQGIAEADRARFDSFIARYRDSGDGAIVISAPGGIEAQAALAFFADRINRMGVPKDHIRVATREASGDQRVQINYVAYKAHTDPCGDWSDDLDYTLDNSTPKNFGCAVQQDIAAQIADPHDLVAPRAMDGADANRRAAVLGKYEQGQVTAAQKSQDQSATVSDAVQP